MNPAVAQVEELEEADQKVGQAINYLDRNIAFGARAGINLSSFNDDKAFNADQMLGLHLGLFGRYRIGNTLAAKLEVMYSMQGARADEFSIFKDYSVNLNYLKVPILAEVIFTNKVIFEVGPYFGFLLNANQSFEELSEPTSSFDVKSDETNNVDVGFAIGGIYYLSDIWGLGVRYNQGFADALGKDFFRDASGANAVIQFSTIYHFR
jgi:hypothetical protein